MERSIAVMILKKFFKLPFKEKTMLVEAFYWLVVTRFVILLFPFRKIAPMLGKHMKETEKEFQSQSTEILLQINRSIRRTSRYCPWESNCLVQSITGKMMLKRRKIPSTLYLGIARDGEKESGLKAHAWLRSGKHILTGNKGLKQFTVVSTFGDEEK